MNQINRRQFFKTLGTGSLALTLAGCSKQTGPDPQSAPRPNTLIFLADDMGYSDIGCYGGEIDTPNLDWLAKNGLRFTQFYNTARCCPSRASLLTGLYPHQADMGHMTSDTGRDGYRGELSQDSVTIAQVLQAAGYSTYMAGKWHVSFLGKKDNWPLQRGFEDYYGIITGASGYFQPSTLTRNNDSVEMPQGDYYLTDAITDDAVRQIREHSDDRPDRPFFQYVAYTAPHWPLHAYEEDIAKYKGRFDKGWDKLREERLERMVEAGLIDPKWRLTPRDESQPPWEEAENKAWQLRRMEVYAAQVDRMDQGIGKILNTLRETGSLDNTLILFLSDNGGCEEELEPRSKQWMKDAQNVFDKTRDGRDIQVGNDRDVMPGGAHTYQSYGVPWANLSNTPFREYKHWVHEGGIATPLIAHWPKGMGAHPDSLCHVPAQLPDIMATCVELAGAKYPETFNGTPILPHEGHSLTSLFNGKAFPRETLFWEHEGNCAVRKGKWKLVRKYPGEWELYNIVEDRTELNDLSAKHTDVVQELSSLYQNWAERCSIQPWEDFLKKQRERREARRKKRTENK